MTFKINDGHKNAPIDITVGGPSSDKGRIRLHMQYTTPEFERLRATALLEPYAAHQVADALIREHNDLTGGKLRIINKDSPAFLVEMYGGGKGAFESIAGFPPCEALAGGERAAGKTSAMNDTLDAVAYAMGRAPPAGKVDDDARRAKPGERIPGLGGAVKMWHHSYTQTVHAALAKLSGFGDTTRTLRMAGDLLLDYWKSMHKIYEDRDHARAELAVVREMHRGVVAKMRREIDRETKLRVDSDRQLRETNSRIGTELRKLKDTHAIVTDALTYERTSHADTRKSLSVARDELNKAADKRRDLERTITTLQSRPPLAPKRCACKAMYLPSAGGQQVERSWHSWSACTVKA